MDRRRVLAIASWLVMWGMSFVQAGASSHPRWSPDQQPPPNPALEAIDDDPALPRVLLIGDSISIGYTLPTRALLQGKRTCIALR